MKITIKSNKVLTKLNSVKQYFINYAASILIKIQLMVNLK